MLQRVVYLLSSAIVIVASGTTKAERQLPAPDQAQLVGAARLVVRVIASDDGSPVRRASVLISGLPDSQQNAGPKRVYVSRRVETDANGRLELASLPAGGYSIISVEPVSGFLRLAHPTGATLAEGQTVQVTIRLDRAGAIEGRVLDDSGDGVLGAQIAAVRRLDLAGYTRVEFASGWATTNDLGEFRLYNLRPGDYYVVATGPPRHRAIDAVESSSRWGYANTYYPGSVALRDARPVRVRAGRDAKRIIFTLARRPLVRVVVRPVNSSGFALGPETSIVLSGRGDIDLPSSLSVPVPQRDGTFVFEGVAAGDYYLVVTTGFQTGEAAYVNVSVGNEDVSLDVQTNRGARVSGRLIVDGRPLGDELGPRIVNAGVYANPPLGQYGVSYAHVLPARVQGDRFELTGLRGPMVLNAEIGLGMLVSIRRAGQEIAGKTLELVGTENIDDVVVEFTMKVAKVDVTVTGTSAPDAPEPVLLILFSDDPSLWHHGYLQYARTTTTRLGSLGDQGPGSQATRLIRMVPGPYRVIAIHDEEIGNPTEPALLEKLRPFATPVTLTVGQTPTVTLHVAKIR